MIVRLFKNRITRQILHALTLLSLVAALLSGDMERLRVSAQGITTINVSDTVVTPSVKRFGINLGWADYYDSGQIMKQLLFQNPGFEGQVYRSIIRCASGTADTCLSDNPYAAWTTDFWAGASYEVIWGASKGRTGIIASSSTASRTSTGTGPTFQFADSGVAPAAGDYLVVRKTENGGATVGWVATTSGGGTITAETADLSPDTQGRQAVRLSATGSGESATLATYFETSRFGSFIQLNGTFRLSFKAKGAGGVNTLNVNLGRLSRGSTAFLNETRVLTSSWATIDMDFIARENGTASGPVQLRFTAQNPSAILLDDVSLSQIDGDPGNTTAFRDAVVDALKSFNPGILRYWNSDDLGDSLDNEIAPPLARLRSGYSTHATVSDRITYGLHEFLELCELLGAEAWYVIPPSFSAQEMTNLMEYLGGPGDTTYGAKRTARGHAAPWTDVLPRIHLEFGNEAWNAANFAGATIQDSVAYGNRASEMFGIAKSSPYYVSSKYDMVLGGQASFVARTLAIHNASTNHDTVAVAPYIGHEVDNYATNEELFGPLFAEPEMVNQAGGYMRRDYDNVQRSAKPVPLVVYEVNLETIRGSIPQTALDSFTPSAGAGVAVADHMLMMLRDLKIRDQNVYSLTTYASGTLDPNKHVLLFGIVRDMGVTNRKRPQYLAVKLANEALAGDLIQTTQSGDNPTWNQPLLNTVQYNNAHYIQSYAFSSGGSRSLIIFNLSRSSSLPVNFAGVNAPSGTVTLKRLTAAAITDTNEDAENVTVTSQTLNNFGPNQSLSLPPFSMSMLQWQVSPAAYSFTVADRGATSLMTGGAAPATSVGYGRIQPNTGSMTPSGRAIFGFRQNNILVSETGVPASLPLSSGRIYAEINGPVNTGLAITNPNNSAATIRFFFTDTAGNDLGSGSTTIPANGQLAGFLDQTPFNRPAPFQGTFSFSSNVPVGAIALRAFTNERSDFLMSTLPVIDTTAPPGSGTVVVPHFADGGGWITQIFLVNPTENPMTGNVQFATADGAPANVTIGGQTNTTFGYAVPKRSSQRLGTTGTNATIASGSVRIIPSGGGSGPTPLVLFSYKPATITVSEAGMPAISGTTFRMYVESSGAQSDNVQSGIAVANTSSSPAVVTFDVTTLSGGPAGVSPATFNLPGLGQTAKFLSEVFPSLGSPFRGVLRVTTTSSGLSVAGLRARVNERRDFLITTTQPAVESNPAATREALFPYLADGGGYTTQFILFSGSAGESSGTLGFFDQGGQPLSVKE